MFLHEIGYLVIDSALKCWLVNAVMTCPGPKNIKPDMVALENPAHYEFREVHYEKNAIAVSTKKSKGYEIKNKHGGTALVPFSVLKKKTPAGKANKDDEKTQYWHFESLDEILKSSMLHHDPDILSFLKKDDLETPILIPKEKIISSRRERILELVLPNVKQYPTGYIEIPNLCSEYVVKNCVQPKKAAFYDDSDYESDKLFEELITRENFEGRSKPTGAVKKKSKFSNGDQLFIFGEEGDWLVLKRRDADYENRYVWVNKKELPYNIVKIKSEDQMRTYLDFIIDDPDGPMEIRTSSDGLDNLLHDRAGVDLVSAGETKWHKGVLWLKVHVKDAEKCLHVDSKILATGWVPYYDQKTKRKMLGWYSRGC